MYTERNTHSGLIGSLCFLASLLLLIFHTRGVLQNRGALAQTRAVLADEVGVLSGEKEGEIVREISEVEERELAKSIPTAVEQDGIIRDLSRLAEKADVSFNGLTFSLGGQGELKTVTISAGFDGADSNVIRFLKSLEGNSRTFIIRDASVSHAETAGGIDFVSLQLTLQAFYRAE